MGTCSSLLFYHWWTTQDSQDDTPNASPPVARTRSLTTSPGEHKRHSVYTTATNSIVKGWDWRFSWVLNFQVQVADCGLKTMLHLLSTFGCFELCGIEPGMRKIRNQFGCLFEGVGERPVWGFWTSLPNICWRLYPSSWVMFNWDIYQPLFRFRVRLLFPRAMSNCPFLYIDLGLGNQLVLTCPFGWACTIDIHQA